jgi:aminoglycoside phosphotransferase (APT) family kinase protein
LLKAAIEQAKRKISALTDDLELSLLHTDVNGANIFVKDGELEGVIDWSDAKYGDWLFDFARFRMNIRQRMDDRALEAYFSGAQLSDVEKQREETYYLLNVLDYTNWYVRYGWDEMVLMQMDLLGEIQNDS